MPADSLFCPLCGADTPTVLASDLEATVIGEPDSSRSRLQAALGSGFEVGDKLGEGGFGEVYRARDVRLKRNVAVKLLRRELLVAKEFVERFEREAQALAALRHPNIVPVYSIGEAGDVVYIVMPFIEGVTLTRYLKEHRPLPLEEARRILVAVGSALGAAHAVGLVHRDVKPDNVMLEGPERLPLLMDFGIAKPQQASSGGKGLTTKGMVLGTPLYMSPEQATADPEVDGRADIYSLGVLAYEMFTGTLPYDGDSVQAVIGHHLTTPPPEARSVRPDIPAPVSEALRRAMAKRPRERFQRVEEFLEALSGGAGSQPRRARIRFGMRRLVAAGLGAALLAGAVMGIRKGLERVERAPVRGTIQAGLARFRIASEAAPWDKALVMGSLGISGLERVSLPAAGEHPAIAAESPTLFLQALDPDSARITIDPIRVPARTLIGVRPTGAAGVVQLSLGDSLPMMPVSVRGRIAVSLPDRPVDTVPFVIDQIQLAASTGALDLELGLGAGGAVQPLASLPVAGVSFDDVSRFRSEEDASEEQVSTISGGTLALTGPGGRTHTLAPGEALALRGFQGTLRDLTVDSITVGLTLDGTIDSLPPVLGAMPTRLQMLWAQHPVGAAGAGVVYLACLGLITLLWRRAE
jgi:hypothetical protein